MMKLKKEMVASRQSTNVLRIYNYHRFQISDAANGFVWMACGEWCLCVDSNFVRV